MENNYCNGCGKHCYYKSLSCEKGKSLFNQKPIKEHFKSNATKTDDLIFDMFHYIGKTMYSADESFDLKKLSDDEKEELLSLLKKLCGE